jgi:hypothetical protein
VSVDSSPPVQPPQLSPDGQWVWDGTQWQPVAAAEPVHAGVFPSWKGIQVEAPDPTTQFVEPTAAPVQNQSPPAVDYSYQQADEPGVPLWQQSKGPGKSLYLYPIAALAVLVMIMIVLNSVGYIQLPFVGASSATPSQAPRPSPTPDFSGPESARADRFLNSIAPAATALDKTVPALRRYCYRTLATNCYDAVTATEAAVKNLLALITHGDIARCIAPQVASALDDVKLMDKDLTVALSGFQDNSGEELYQGVYHFGAYYALMSSSLAAATQAKTKCYTVVLPTWVP